MKKNKRLFSIFYIFILLTSFGYTQTSNNLEISKEAQQNYLELEEKYQLSIWNNTNSLFAYADNDTVIIIDTKLSKVINRVQIDSPISYIQFQNSRKYEQTKMFVISDKGEIFFLNCKNGKILWIGETSEDSKLTAAAFNSTGDALVTGYDNGAVILYNQQGDSNFFVPEELSGIQPLETTKINFLNFSSDKKYLLFGDSSGTLIIWNLTNKTEEGRFKYNPDFGKSAFFTGDENNILILIDTLTAGIFDFNGNLKQKIQLEYTLKKMSLSSDGKTIMIVSNNNKKNYYNVNNSGSLEDITDSVIAANTAARYSSVKSTDAAVTDQPAIPNINDAEYQRIIIDNEQDTIQIEVLKPEGDSPVKPLVENPSHEKNYDVIEAGAKFGIGPSPFTINTCISSGYITYRFLEPFYFGGKADFGIGFPQGDFPYTYQAGSRKLPNPKLFTTRIYGLAGITFYPFEPEIELYTDISLGYTGTFLWNISSTYSTTSKLYSSLFTDIRIGVSYKGFKFWIDCTYEPIFRTCINIGTGYEFKLPDIKQKAQK